MAMVGCIRSTSIEPATAPIAVCWMGLRLSAIMDWQAVLDQRQAHVDTMDANVPVFALCAHSRTPAIAAAPLKVLTFYIMTARCMPWKRGDPNS